MKKITHSTILFIFALHINLSVYAEADFSDKEKSIIYTHSMNILQDYQRLINEMGVFAVSNTEAAQSSLESFLELFVNRQVLIYNDLDPTHNLSAFYEAETYVANLMLWYPDGMRINMDFENAKAGNIMEHDEGIYSLDIMISKKIEGNYLNRTQNKNKEELLFRIAFNRRMGGFGGYKIVGIRDTDLSAIPDFDKNIDEVNAEELSKNDQRKMEEGMKAIMNDYVNYIALLGNPDEFEEDKVYYRESFTGLFEDESVKLFNDLEPDPENSIISVEEYLGSLKNDYPAGIRNVSIPVDSAEIGKAIKTEEGYYYSTFNGNKFFSGNFQGKEAYSDVFPLTVKIRFEKSGNAFTHFKIQGIDIEADDFYQSDENADDLELPNISITTVTRKGLSVSFEAGYGQTTFENRTMRSLSNDFDSHEWVTTPAYGLKAVANVYYFINDNFGLKSGLGLHTFESTMTLDGTFTESQLTEDANGNDYYKIIEASYDSLLTSTQLAIPIVANYTYGTPGKLGFFVEGGVVLGLNIRGRYETTGSYVYRGYYPDMAPSLQNLDPRTNDDLKVFGFYYEPNINRTGKLPIKNISIFGYASLGVNISLGYFSSLKIGPEIYYGLNDIDISDEYTDIFGKNLIKKNTILNKYSLKLGYTLKL